MAGNSKKNRKSSGSGSVAVGIISFVLGFIFALIVLVGSIFGVGYVAVTTDINEVLRVFGLENEDKSAEGDEDKYNYINADTAPNILALIQEIVGLANEFDTLNLNKIDALAPVTDTVLGFAYEFIDEVVDFDKEYFEDVPLTSILDCLTNSVYYVRTSKVIELLNSKMGYNVDLSEVPIADYLVNGIEAQYATVAGMGEDFKLPVLFDYYIKDEGGIGYNRTEPVNGTYAYPTGLSDEYATETMSTDSDGKTLYKVYYVPCKLTPTGIEEAEYIATEKAVSDPNVSYVKDGVTYNLTYRFRTIKYGEDTVFIAVKPQTVDGVDTFVLDFDTIITDTASCTYFEDYARNYYTGPKASESNDRLYGVSTINNINYFRNVAGEVVEYDPLIVADIMLDAMGPLNNVPVYTVVGGSQAEVVKNIFGDTSLGDVLNNNVDFNNLINKIYLSTFLSDVSVTDKVMSYIVFNISSITDDGHGNYTAIYDKGGDEETTVKLEVVDGKIKSVKDSNDETLKGNNVGNLNQLTVNLTLDVFLDVKADDAIMAYLGYGIKDVVEVSDKDWQYEGKDTGDNPVRIYTDASGIITKVTDTSGNNVKGTTVDEVSDRVENITSVLTLPDVIDVDPSNAIMAYIGYGITEVEEVADKDYKYTGVYDSNTVYIYVDANNYVTKVTKTGGEIITGTAIDDVSARIEDIMDVLTLPDFIDIDPDDAIMTYIAYGIYDVTAQSGTNNGKTYSYTGTYKQDATEVTVYLNTKIKDENTYVKSVWFGNDGAKVKGTKLNDVSARLDGITDAITISEFIDIDATDAILAYLGYGVYDVVAVDGQDWQFEATYDNGVEEIAVRIYADTNIITKVTDTTVNQNVIKGTKIGKVADMLDGITDVIAITEFIDIDPTDAIMAYMGYGINKVSAEDGTDSLGNSYSYKGMYGTTNECYITVDGSGNIDSVWYIDSGAKKVISGTKVGNVPGKISSLQDTLTIGEIIEVDGDSSKILVALKDTTINDLDTKIKSLTVEDVLTEEQINSNSIIRQIRDKNIFDISDEIDKVLIQQIYAANIYGVAENADPTLALTYYSEYLYYERTGNEEDGYKYEITTVGCPVKPDGVVEGTAEYSAWETAYDNAVGKLTAEQFAAGEYYTYGAATGMWKLVLYRMDATGKTEKAYTLNNFNNMVNACSETVYNSTLGELKEAGIIAQDTNLDKYMKIGTLYITFEAGVPTTTTEQSEGAMMSDLTLKQLLDVVLKYITADS